jgi:DNA-binding MarR family transcriptional regulator
MSRFDPARKLPRDFGFRRLTAASAGRIRAIVQVRTIHGPNGLPAERFPFGNPPRRTGTGAVDRVDYPHHGPLPVEPGPPAARWLELAEQLTICGRLFRGVLSPLTERRRVSESLLSLLLVCRSAPPEGLAQTHIASVLAISPASVSLQVEQLRAEGLLKGHRVASDRRRQLWRLTEAGAALLEGILADLADWSAGMDASLGPDLVREMTAWCDRLQDALGRHGARTTVGADSVGDASRRRARSPTESAPTAAGSDDAIPAQALRPFDPPGHNASEPLPGTPAAAIRGRTRRRRAG